MWSNRLKKVLIKVINNTQLTFGRNLYNGNMKWLKKLEKIINIA